MTKITYADAVGGKEVYAPDVERSLARDFLSHREEIESIMEGEGLHNWNIRIHSAEGNGKMCVGHYLHGLDTILLSLSGREEMLVTLYHEIIHHKYAEAMIEGLARHLYDKYESKR